MATLRLYHGTAHDFETFDRHYALRGTEPNSALGIHLSESPAIAADYAELAARDCRAGEPRVLIVNVEVGRAALVSSVEDFLGRPMDMPLDHDIMRTREEFVAAKHDLEDQGFHAVALDTSIEDLVGTWVVFDPGRIWIVGRMTVEEAYRKEEQHESEAGWDGVDLVSACLFDSEDTAVSCP